MSAKPNYIEERQKFIPQYFDTESDPEAKRCYDKDTKLGDILSRYSTMFKKENVQASKYPFNSLRFFRRGEEVYNKLIARFPEAVTDQSVCALVIDDYRGNRIHANFDEDTAILVFDNNGFLVASNLDGKSITMVIDDVLYIVFKHGRYDGNEPEEDKNCSRSKTRSDLFSIVGITYDHIDCEPYSVLRCVASEAHAGYDLDCTASSDSPVTTVPDRFGVYHDQDTIENLNFSRINRILETDTRDLSIYVKVDLDACAEILSTIINDPNTDLTNVPGITVTDFVGTLTQLKNALNEVVNIVKNRAHFIKYVEATSGLTITSGHGEVWAVPTDTNKTVLSLGFTVVKDYKPFEDCGTDAKITYTLPSLPKGSQLYVQTRDRAFVTHLEYSRQTRNPDPDRYDIHSTNDNDVLGQYIKNLRLFNELNGLYAIPLFSFKVSNGDRVGFPCCKVEAADVLIWVDGVKLVPYEDYIVANGVDSTYSCQYIRMLRMPNAVVTDSEDVTFPLPKADDSYEITVVVTCPKGHLPEGPEGEDHYSDLSNEGGIRDRYIGPSSILLNGNTADGTKRNIYPGGSTSNPAGRFLFANSGIRYAAFKYYPKIIPVGAIPEMVMLTFQCGRYVKIADYSGRVIGDRILAFPHKFTNLQDIELHFMLDTKIPALRDALETLAKEKDNIDYILEKLGWDNSEIQRRIVGWLDSKVYNNASPTTDNSKAGYNFWIHTSGENQNGNMGIFIDHAGYDIKPVVDVYLDPSRNLEPDGFLGDIDADPTNPVLSGESDPFPDTNL